MASTQGRTRTNYFAVNDKEAFSRMVDSLATNEDEKVRMIENSKGEVGFCCEDVVYGLKDRDDMDEDEMENTMIKQIQELLMPGHACIMTDIIWDSLRTVNASSLIITKDHVSNIDLMDKSVDIAKELLDDPGYNPDMIC